MTIQQIKDEIASIQNQIQPLAQRKALLERQLRDAESIEFIRVNNITKEDVEFSRGDEKPKPFFNHISQLTDWMLHNNSPHTWLEWNEMIWRVGPGYCVCQTPALVEHLS